jgi:hypothetical protein
MPSVWLIEINAVNRTPSHTAILICNQFWLFVRQ